MTSKRTLGLVLWGASPFVALGVPGCEDTASQPEVAGRESVPAATRAPPGRPDLLAPLHAHERQARTDTNFAAVPAWSQRSGTDPFELIALPDGSSFGLLRGADTLVYRRGEDTFRLPTPAGPTGLATSPGGSVWVVGEGSSQIAEYRREDPGWVEARRIAVQDVHALRDIAVLPGDRLALADWHRGRVLIVDAMPNAPTTTTRSTTPCRGALQVQAVGSKLLANCMLDHAVLAFDVEPDGALRELARIEHDGPMWAIDGVADERGVTIAVAGVEDHPLDRTEGFGYVDSFVWLYRLGDGASPQPQRVASVNVSEHHVVTPKAIRLEPGGTGWSLLVSGYGSDRLLFVELAQDGALQRTRVRQLLPGISSFVGEMDRGWAASPLLDAWIRWDGETTEVVAERDASDDRGVTQRVGEALAFTTLMAPWNASEGMASRFTCETCHFEGGVDGRTHYTGRGRVHATTKPLRGLFENRPHFTRALDRTMTKMVHNEFRVANKSSGRSSWFALPVSEHPWLRHLGVSSDELGPIELRRSLMDFLMAFSHDPNPVVAGREAFTETERQGAELFATWCESCHQARRVTDQPESRVPPEQWEREILGGGRIVWARSERYRTGIQPYVHDEGARVTSLRRLHLKAPYFTNGSAPTIADVLATILVGDEVRHDGTPSDPDRHLTKEERQALAAFLDLL